MDEVHREFKENVPARRSSWHPMRHGRGNGGSVGDTTANESGHRSGIGSKILCGDALLILFLFVIFLLFLPTINICDTWKRGYWNQTKFPIHKVWWLREPSQIGQTSIPLWEKHSTAGFQSIQQFSCNWILFHSKTKSKFKYRRVSEAKPTETRSRILFWGLWSVNTGRYKSLPLRSGFPYQQSVRTYSMLKTICKFISSGVSTAYIAPLSPLQTLISLLPPAQNPIYM